MGRPGSVRARDGTAIGPRSVILTQDTHPVNHHRRSVSAYFRDAQNLQAI
jgi:hypothetical protein